MDGIIMINEYYTIQENIFSIHDYFNNNSPKSVILQDFFNMEFMKSIYQKLENVTFERIENPIKNCYQISDFPFLQEKMNSKEFLEFFTNVTGYEARKLDFKVFKLTWKDYKIIHDEEIENAGIDIIIDLTKIWKNNFGGNIIYVDINGDYLEIPVSYGLLAIVKREETDHKYIRYVNNLSRQIGNRFIAIGNSI